MPSPVSYTSLANRMLTGFAKVGERQAFEHLVEDEYGIYGTSKPHSACALGALMLGTLKPAQVERYTDNNPYDYWPANAVSLNKIIDCPDEPDIRNNTVESIITHLNDDHRWTIPQIAEWLKSLDETPA